MKVQRSASERIGNGLVCAFLIAFAFTTTYPFWHVVMYSISDSHAAMRGGLFLWPRQIDFLAYTLIFKTTQIFVAYGNTILRTLIGTLLSIIITCMTAYPLSLKRFRGRSFFSMMIFFTMLFSGGMIPTFLLVQSLGLIDTFWALVLPGMMSAYNMFIVRNYFQSLPASLEESAHIDGANAFVVLLRIIIP
ncbi:MAG: carbohydrate ABC transporter permease, partial [Clostridia bacterium]